MKFRRRNVLLMGNSNKVPINFYYYGTSMDLNICRNDISVSDAIYCYPYTIIGKKKTKEKKTRKKNNF